MIGYIGEIRAFTHSLDYEAFFHKRQKGLLIHLKNASHKSKSLL
uniref:Uncharacterized protein n=1 Tax=Arundo donax TaxID=35708 RepID=A0A0A9BRY3_ARUDO